MNPKLLRGTAILLTALIGLLHLYFALHAGGMWRDEAQTMSMARMDSLAEIWDHLAHGSFPMLWYLVLRAIDSLFQPSDLGYRLLGCGVGLSLVAVLWLNARTLKFGVPLISLALLGFNPMVLRWGDSIRAYGFGTVLILLNFAAIWKVVTAPTRRNVLLAAVLSICSVQVTYHNTMLLFGMGVAGITVAARNGQWKRAAIVAGLGVLAALSMLPYAPSMLARNDWNIVFLKSEFDLPWFITMLGNGTDQAGIAWAWPLLAAGAIILGVRALRAGQGTAERADTDQALFCLITALCGGAAYFLLFKFMRYPTIVWNYLPLLALVALILDAIWSRIDRSARVGAGRAVLAALIAMSSFLPTWHEAQERQTNVDLVAARLHELAGPNDMILVSSWYYGISFDYYYRGSAPWTALPPIAEYRIFRYDLFKQQMSSPDPLRPVVEAVTRTLKAGHRVYVVGDLKFPTEKLRPVVYRPAPLDVVGWDANAYQKSWWLHMGSLLGDHVVSGEQEPLESEQPVQTLERHRLWVLEGWRESQP